MAVANRSVESFRPAVLVVTAMKACLRIETTTIAASVLWEQPSCSIACCAAVAPVDGAVAVLAAVTAGVVSEVAVPADASDSFFVCYAIHVDSAHSFIYIVNAFPTSQILFTMKMSKALLSVIAVFGFFVLAFVSLFFYGISQQRSMVVLSEDVEQKMADVQSQYQRRADLIPNLVSTVKGYAKHESATLENVIAARARATQITLDPANATPEQIEAYQNAQGQLSQALGKLLSVQEQYPELKANEQFSQLQAQLEGTENRINESRQIYNEAVKTYNIKVKQFPGSLFAGFFGMSPKTPFRASEAAQTAPSVQF